MALLPEGANDENNGDDSDKEDQDDGKAPNKRPELATKVKKEKSEAYEQSVVTPNKKRKAGSSDGQYLCQPMPPLPAPPLKRHCSNHFFERCAFFATNGRGDSNRSLAPPNLNRQQSLLSLGNVSIISGICLDEQDLPGMNFGPPELVESTSNEFYSDFY